MSSKTKTAGTKEEAKPALVPKLRFPEFREAGGWKERQLGDFLRESRLPGSKGDVAKKITVKLWGNGVFEKNDAIQGSINTQYFRRKAGQFVYSKLDFLNQALGIIPPSLDNFESTVDLPCFDITGGLNPVFLLEYVKRRDFYERLGETADGSRKARRIHAETFLSFSAALPTPAEQQKIAKCLSSVDELIAAQARKVDALKTHKKGLMQQLFPCAGETQPRLRFPEFRNAGEWMETTLGKLAKLVRGPFGGSLKKEIFVASGYAVYEQQHAIYADFSSFRYRITAEKFHALSRFAVAASDIIMSCSGTMGKFAIVPDGAAPGVINQALLKLTPSGFCDTEFLKDALELPSVQERLLSQSAGGAIQNVVSVDQISALPLRLPGVEEQRAVVGCLRSLDRLITAETQKLEALRTHKKGLMQQLFPSPEEQNTL